MDSDRHFWSSLRNRGAVHPVAAATAIAVGAAVAAGGRPDVAKWMWFAGLAITGLPVIVRTVRSARHGRFATDIVAMLAIVAALALGQPVAGLVIVLMQTGGEALERIAEGRASAAVRALEAAAPRLAHRMNGDLVEDVPATMVAVEDILLVRPGELVPTDGLVINGASELDTSQLTGEAAPLAAARGTRLMSGMANLNGTFRMRVTAKAAESQYARIVELVRTAQASKAPIQRMADRWAVWFTPIALLVCTITFVMTHDWTRVLAVLVVATPCPLILAMPIAIIGGINREAHARVIVRDGGALERLSQVTTMVFDKTGTLTVGRPQVSRIIVVGSHDERFVLRHAEAAEHGSSHLLARVVSEYARARLAPKDRAWGTQFDEQPGRGVRALVEGRTVDVGSRAYVAARGGTITAALAAIGDHDGVLRSYVAVDGQLAGVIEYADEMRPGLPALLQRLRTLGIRHIALLSGDHEQVVRTVAARAGISDARGELLPADKAAVINQRVRAGEIVGMVGDGTNDAPALSAAHVGIALAGHGGGITAEAANVILLVDELDRLGDAVAIAQRTMRIARQSVGIGLGLSGVAMMVAAVGYLAPIPGAVIQEAIDVAVILNALRAAR